MLLNKIKNKKDGATAIFMVFAVPIFLMVFAFMLDSIIAANIQNRLQRTLDVSVISTGYLAQENGCHVSPDNIKSGMDLFVKNLNGQLVEVGKTDDDKVQYKVVSGSTVMYLEDRTSDDERINGITKFLVQGKYDAFYINYMSPVDFDFTVSAESISICNTDKDGGGVIMP